MIDFRFHFNSTIFELNDLCISTDIRALSQSLYSLCILCNLKVSGWVKKPNKSCNSYLNLSWSHIVTCSNWIKISDVCLNLIIDCFCSNLKWKIIDLWFNFGLRVCLVYNSSVAWKVLANSSCINFSGSDINDCLSLKCDWLFLVSLETIRD